ncbi:hypothetical protein ACTQ5K_00305 [Niallia sp. Sow4_A1]|uniref:hypothetical protein n=1 Tax=Niallia TaxID=2837506 RepID=UPI000D6BAF26|nr:hypothetical protein [Niallia circulans]MCF2647718.1 hypothetical protein [Niallia circulans]
MSDYQKFLHERDQIDYLISDGYRIKSILEDLNGAMVQLEKQDRINRLVEQQTLRIHTANGRKYFSVLLLEQLKMHHASKS